MLRRLLDHWLYASGRATHGPPHVRDAMNLQRMNAILVVALLPVVFMALWNTGFQINIAVLETGQANAPGWRGEWAATLGADHDPDSTWDNLWHGASYFLPVLLVASLVGALWVIVFASVRRRPLGEGIFVTSLLFSLTLPPGIPLWQVALGISFGVVIGQEVFGGVGRNLLHPALVAWAFVFFAYPGEMSGDSVWVAVDGFTHATPLTALKAGDPTAVVETLDLTWREAFLGFTPGAMGETSTLACAIGAAILLLTRIASWRILLSALIGALACTALFATVGGESNPLFAIPPHWHLVIGGFAFGLVFLATDPVASAQTNAGRWVFGLLVGFLAIFIRVANPGYPEGTMLAILLGSIFAPLIDWFVEQANIRRRQARHA
jgi:Na+-transporting NADH:ubiquinone oxidoreductase subunit B